MKDAARADRQTPAAMPLAVGSSNADGAEIDGVAGTLRGTSPPWQRDGVAISTRVRALLQNLRPVVVAVLSFWDHAVRSIEIGGRRLEVDPSGCYRRC